MYLIDTNTVIDFCNGKLPLNAKNLLTNTEPTISVVTHIELFASPKISEKEHIRLEQFVQIAIVYDHINGEIIKLAIGTRQQYKTPLPDAIIAATALSYNFSLITRNTADFKNIEGLRIIDPYNL
jgi:tRNA(fMet)-specific endonuclease VapC